MKEAPSEASSKAEPKAKPEAEPEVRREANTEAEPEVRHEANTEAEIEAGPIGVFDSGLGGLTVLSALIKALPEESFIYLGDTARVPYGARSAHIVRRYSLEALHFLLTYNIKMLVVACNTATAHAEEFLQAQCPVPIVGVIQPGVEALLNGTNGANRINGTNRRRVGVIATRSTIKSGEYRRRIGILAPDAEIFSQPCPLFVPLVEEGWLDKEITRLIIQEYLAPLHRHKVEAVALGCTHYPLLKPTIMEEFPDLALVDSSEETAKVVAQCLADQKLRSPSHRCCQAPSPQARRRLFLTDLSEQMDWLEQLLDDIHFDNWEEVQL